MLKINQSTIENTRENTTENTRENSAVSMGPSVNEVQHIKLFHVEMKANIDLGQC